MTSFSLSYSFYYELISLVNDGISDSLLLLFVNLFISATCLWYFWGIVEQERIILFEIPTVWGFNEFVHI